MSNAHEPIRLSAVKGGTIDRKRKLGKGLGALLGETRREEPLAQQTIGGEGGDAGSQPAEGALIRVPVADISPLPGQPRTRFDEDALNELASSIATRGVIQPILVTPKTNGKYQLVAGERRWRAAQRAKLHEIPAVVRSLDTREVMALALIENLQREDLNPMEEARAYNRLADEDGLTQSDIAKLVDKSRSHVANIQRLTALPRDVQKLVADGALSMGHARALIGHDEASSLARLAVEENLSVRDIEKRVRQERDGGENDAPRRKKASARGEMPENADIAAVQSHLEEFLGLNVRIKTDEDPSKGSVSISYRTLDQLDLICQRLTGGNL
ncbi:ParB/RepB/Spo0J family partition protein [Altererythrobacter aurantiacus]|uniref:ParB/RepB/Spo0J family partition protein n=1 Tax=Parapontixanthobacter aurantiacus TaxID=1463599 RepID=A0A844ZIU5_9SPHN|nr:ParB/RepB/Spo0J family partition protein [Parapontixanthobacter aurantiacus]MXO86837.1 ParB/RepB/Spo0J family partition protein [Parapontixanthobacter aurantiacus]